MPRSVVVLVLALVAATLLGLGSYYEAGDDEALSWLFSGATAAAPVPAVPLYFHGFGHGLAAAYTALPGVSWFGLLQAGILLAATLLYFAVVHALLRPQLRPGWLTGLLAAFFVLGWLEHWLWFSYVRGALLLAGAAVAWAAQQRGQQKEQPRGPRGAWVLGLAGVGVAWLVRPGLAGLALVAVLPAVLLLAGGWRRAAPLLAAAALLLLGATAIFALAQPPAAAATRTLDTSLARILDYELLTPTPRPGPDSLGVAATRLWLLGDSALTNPGLYQRAYRFDALQYLRQLPARLRLRLGLLARDYFPLLLGLLATALVFRRRRPLRAWFWLVQAGFAGALLLFVALLKLPPRMALPLLDFWVLNNLVFLVKAREADAAVASAGASVTAVPQASNLAAWAWPTPWLRRSLGALALLCLGVYAAKTGHRRHTLGAEQRRHERALNALTRLPNHGLLVLAGTQDWSKSLSPFRVYRLGAGPVLALSGWPAHDASQGRWRRALTGSWGQPEALRRLAARPPGAVVWLLGHPEAAVLNRRLAPVHWRLLAPFAADTVVAFYQPERR